MVERVFKSAGVSAREIDLTGQRQSGPTGVPACVIGTAGRGPAFVPVTVGNLQNFDAVFGESNGERFGPIAAQQWLQNATALTYLRVLGVGKGEKRLTTGDNPGSVESAGFVVGERQPLDNGNFGNNPYAVEDGDLGRLYFLGAYMSESAGSDIFSAAGIQEAGSNVAHPIVRGVLMAASGVILTLSSSVTSSVAPASTLIATDDTDALQGALTGSVVLLDGSVSKQEFVMFLNGHKGTDSAHPNYITASFDSTAPNYFANIFNTDPLKVQESGYYLYSSYDIHPSIATITGVGILPTSAGAGANGGVEESVFITTGSSARNTGTATVPNFENWQDRFSAPKTPYIISQKFGGSPKNLFRIWGLADGQGDAQLYKISIENIAPASSEEDQYGRFDLLVRDINDTDDDKIVLESYRGISLNPSDDRFIAKAIGDEYRYFDFDKSTASQKLVIEGNFPNVSTRIRVELPSSVENGDLESTALPAGFRGHYHLVTSGTAPLADLGTDAALSLTDPIKRAIEVPVPFRKNIAIGVSPKKVTNKNLYWGVQFEKQISTTEVNKSNAPNQTVRSFTKFFPNFMTSNQNFVVGDNQGTLDTDENGILDADRFNKNLFSLENIQVVTASTGKADLKTVENWSYVRAGNIVADDAAKTRALKLDTDLTVLGVRTLTKFSCYMQGGFDGVNIFNEQESKLSNRAIVEEMNFVARGQDEGPTVRAYRKALDIISLTSEVDINILAIPGVRHSVVTDSALLAVENRFDAIYIMDVEERDTVNSVVTSSFQDINVQNTVNAFAARSLDSSFGAAYFPDLIIRDDTTQTNVRVPPSVGVLGAYAFNDAVGFPWFAPAGFTRGVMTNVNNAVVRLSTENLNDLYEVDINPITAFPGGPGVIVWGNKTLQAAQSALDRVNVRRLLLDLRRRIKRVGENFIFEPNRAETLSRFSARVNPILARVQEQAGINRYLVRIDTSTTTQADVENNTVRGVIYIQPTRTIEFVSLDFVVTNQGAEVG